MTPVEGIGDARQWFVMRDLKRTNAKEPAYKMLREQEVEVFTPMIWKVLTRQGKRVRVEVPFMADLLFVHETRDALDPIVEKTPTFQYRWLRGTQREPMTVSDAQMSRFIHAVSLSDSPKYYLPEEITPAMLGHKVHIIGGALDGYEGTLLKVRGSKSRKLLVELPGLLTAAVEISPDYIQVIS